MKIVNLSKFQQSYSLLQVDKPAEVWAVPTSPNREPGAIHGIPLVVIESMTSESEGWCGWGFNEGVSWLLFEKQEDAVMASVSFGETYV